MVGVSGCLQGPHSEARNRFLVGLTAGFVAGGAISGLALGALSSIAPRLATILGGGLAVCALVEVLSARRVRVRLGSRQVPAAWAVSPRRLSLGFVYGALLSPGVGTPGGTPASMALLGYVLTLHDVRSAVILMMWWGLARGLFISEMSVGLAVAHCDIHDQIAILLHREARCRMLLAVVTLCFAVVCVLGAATSLAGVVSA